MKMYNGNKLCPGCGRPGYEKQRYSADDLCFDCRDLLKLGKQAKELQKTQEVYYLVHIYPFYTSDTTQCDIFCKNLFALAKSFSDKTKQTTDTKSIGHYSSHSTVSVVITPAQYDNLLKLYEDVQESFKIIEQKGKEAGSQLLLQLNSGEITLNKFDEQLTRYKR